MRGIVRHIALVIVKIPWDFENGIRLLCITSYMNTRHPMSLKRKRGCLEMVCKYAAGEYIGLQFPLMCLVMHELRQSCDGSCFDV